MKTMNYNFYPDFQENQILSHNDLNSSFKYLNEQGLLTRANLIGTGIVCGLHASFKDGKVFISNGYGITSHGYYIKKGIFSSSSCECDAAEIDTVTSSSVEEFGYVRKVECNYLKSFLKNDDTGDGNVYELLMKGKPEEEITKLFQDVDPLQKYSVFLLYEEKVNGQACNSCGGYKGLEKTITIRQLLVPLEEKSSGKEIPSLRLIDRIAQRLVELPEGDLKEIAESLKGNINTCYNYPLLNEILNNNDYSTAIKKFNPDDFKTAKLNHYNFLCDLTEVYEEFRQYGEKVLLDYRLSTAEFPCHLILNGKYRHHFRPATSSNDYAELNWIWKRIVTMIEYFNPDVKPATDNSIRLTPSVYGAAPLSEKAVPYYYGKTMPYDVWSKRKKPLGYWYEEKKNDVIVYCGYYKGDNWKNYDLERYNFVRIEGHLNQNYIETIKGEIKNKANSFNLPIEVVALSTQEVPAEGCMAIHSDSYFVLLQQEAISDVSTIADVANDIITQSANATTLDEAKKEAQAAAQAASDANKLDEAKTAATLAKQAVTKVLEVIAAAKKIKTVAAAQRAATEAELAASKATLLDEAKKEAQTAAQAASRVADAVIAASRVADAVIAAKKTGTLTSYLQFEAGEQDSFIEKYSIIVSFASDLEGQGITYQKIIAFLQWLDTTRSKYQKCKEFSSFAAFHAQHPGLQHKFGVPIGGTFILVYDEKNTVIADFCLPYRVTQPD